MKITIGFIKPNYPGEKRVAILPQDIKDLENDIAIEGGFGLEMGIPDQDYLDKGAQVMSRADIFAKCDYIFSLKLLQPSDYQYLRKGQTIIGWTHPYGSGRPFYENECIPRDIKVVDLDNITPRLFYHHHVYDLDYIPRNFIYQNSVIAGFSSTYHALMAYGKMPTHSTKIAILSSGNVSQGAFKAVSAFNPTIRMFYRKTMNEFYATISEYDVIINGIQVDQPGINIISKDQLAMLKKSCLIIDAAAHQGRAIYGTKFTYIDEPIAYTEGIAYYCLSNSPSLFYKTASIEISKAFSKYIYQPSVSHILACLDKAGHLYE